jgi:hypothetical protein
MFRPSLSEKHALSWMVHGIAGIEGRGVRGPARTTAPLKLLIYRNEYYFSETDYVRGSGWVGELDSAQVKLFQLSDIW